MAMAISNWVLLFLVVSIAAGLSGVANRSSVSADVAGALFDALIIFVVLLVLVSVRGEVESYELFVI